MLFWKKRTGKCDHEKGKQPVTPGDLKLRVLNKGGPLVLVLDGKIMHDTLRDSPYSEAWLLGEFKRKGNAICPPLSGEPPRHWPSVRHFNGKERCECFT